MPNHLLGESSRYLQQHADNPVDWYPWGEAALAKARAEDKPIFLSIGYAACHWCHVMAHESFEDEATAAILNEHFVSIKVDREERPDLDQIYMSAVQAMTGRGGWPMSVFLTPEGHPFYGGTYFPDTPRHGLPAFKEVLLALADAWDHRRDELLEGGEQLAAWIKQQQALTQSPEAASPDPEVIDSAYRELLRKFDATNGGWGTAPKFPQPMALEFLLRVHHTTGDPQALAMAARALEAMAHGGIYDQLGGGFHRYAVDAHWTVPHFEKMLYDNAQLARLYLHAWQVTGERLFRAVAEETLDYVQREMAAPQGGFYATQDADSEGGEGAFFVWTPVEIEAVLGDQAAEALGRFGVREGGNFEGKSILTFTGTFEEREALADARQALLEHRQQRPHPGRDEKVLTSWNGLMIAAFAAAAQALDRDDYREAAERSAGFLLHELRTLEGRLWHVWKDGAAKVPGLLEDYAHLIEGLLVLYQATFAPHWYTAAVELAEAMIAHFSAEAGFYDTADDAESLIVRPRDLQDNALPSGNAMAATVLLKLARLSGESRYAEIAQRSIIAMQPLIRRYPRGFGQWLVALNDLLAPPTEVAIIGDPRSRDTQALLAIAREGYHPHRLLAAGTGEEPALLRDRAQHADKATAYVCRAATCADPTNEPTLLRGQLT